MFQNHHNYTKEGLSWKLLWWVIRQSAMFSPKYRIVPYWTEYRIVTGLFHMKQYCNNPVFWTEHCRLLDNPSNFITFIYFCYKVRGIVKIHLLKTEFGFDPHLVVCFN